MKDRIEKGEVEIQYCPTLEMWADYFPKPLQGALFHKFWDVIMGYAHISTLKIGLMERNSDVKSNISALEIKEHVGGSIFKNSKNNSAQTYKSILMDG